MSKRITYFIFLIFLSSFFEGCLPAPKEMPPRMRYDLVLVKDKEMPYFRDDLSRESLKRAAEGSLAWLLKLPKEKEFIYGPLKSTAEDIIYSLELFLKLIEESESLGELTRAIRKNFHVFRSVGRGQNGLVLFTGYYEPILRGSRKRTERYQYPIYGKPADLIQIDLGDFQPKYRGDRIFGQCNQGKFVPYYSRKEIDSDGVLSGRNLEIAWLDDPVELFFLHIEGSGLIKFEDGTSLRVNYAAQNGRPYRSIGRLLINERKLLKEEVSLESIKNFLKKNPREAEKILNYNESYIFFRAVEEGPLGCLEIPLTPGRSIAADHRCFPSAGLAFIITKKPLLDEAGRLLRWEKFSRFVFNQDAGGAIAGPGRVDLFFGTGKEAGAQAGYIQNEGELYFLVAKNRRSDSWFRLNGN